MSVPKLRFKEFECDWEEKKFKDVTEILRCGIASTPVYVEKGIPFLSAQNVNSNGQVILDKYSFITKDFYEKISKNHKLLKGDLLYSRVGASFGNSAVFQLDGEYGIYVSLTHIRPNKTLNNFYLNFYLNSDKGKKQAENGVFQGGGVPNLNVKIVEKFEISFPIIQEQTKIAKFLMAVDEKIAQLTQKCELLAQYKKGVMQQIFSQELRFKDDNGRNFPAWEESTIGDMVAQRSEKFNPEKSEDNPKCIELEHLSQETGQLLGYTTVRKQKSIKNKFKKGDVLFGKLRSYLKKFLKAPFDGVCSSEIWVLIGKTVSNDFVYQFVQTENFITLANVSSGSKMPRSDWSIVASGEILYPSSPEQIKIANFLTAIDEKITEAQTYLEAVKQYKQGLLQQMFV